jgi:hypothetical protein
MALPDELPGAPVPEAPLPLLDPRPKDAIPRATRASDASAVVRPDEAEAAELPALADAPYAERLAALVPAVPARAAMLFPRLERAALCKRDAAQSAA